MRLLFTTALCFLAVVCCLSTAGIAQTCPNSLAQCPDVGCTGTGIDPNLNKRKNIVSDNQTPIKRTLAYMKGLDGPTHFTEGGDRTELRNLGEGDKITVVAFLIAAKKGSKESCNCRLAGTVNMDNHLVLVTKETLRLHSFDAKEKQSTTAEITPRVRKLHPKWTKANLDPMIRTSRKKALMVRLTGLLMFDSEHFFGGPLVRVNDWEIHPILKFEYCTKGHSCSVEGSTGWRLLDSI
jgi:hypothetical protein